MFSMAKETTMSGLWLGTFMPKESLLKHAKINYGSKFAFDGLWKKNDESRTKLKSGDKLRLCQAHWFKKFP